ncbi:MAG TPA: hypothetical protein VEA99_17490, partial [Gemmatimonadaceae bacterium]|nr:hypothetical protein [Gemmatimonadaceae bacterium]
MARPTAHANPPTGFDPAPISPGATDVPGDGDGPPPPSAGWPRLRRRALGYLLATILPPIAWAVLHALGPEVERAAIGAYVLAIVIAAAVGGMGPGFLATALALPFGAV